MKNIMKNIFLSWFLSAKKTEPVSEETIKSRVDSWYIKLLLKTNKKMFINFLWGNDGIETVAFLIDAFNHNQEKLKEAIIQIIPRTKEDLKDIKEILNNDSMWLNKKKGEIPIIILKKGYVYNNGSLGGIYILDEYPNLENHSEYIHSTIQMNEKVYEMLKFSVDSLFGEYKIVHIDVKEEDFSSIIINK